MVPKIKVLGLIIFALFGLQGCVSNFKSAEPAAGQKEALRIYDNDADYMLPRKHNDKYFPEETTTGTSKFYPYYYY